MSESDPPSPPTQDVLFVHGAAPEGEGIQVIRKRADAIEVGEIRPVKEGQPLHGELVRLKKRPENDRLFDVEVLVSRKELAAAAPRGHAGPAQVATETYRTNWDTIFGPREPDPDELPS